VLARLRGAAMPALTLHSASFGSVEMDEMTRNAAVVYFYTGARSSPGDAALAGGLEQSYPQLLVKGFHLIGVHAQAPEEQLQHMGSRQVDHILVADPELRLARSLGVPTCAEAGLRAYQRAVLVLERGRVIHAIHPVLEPAWCASELLAWLEHRRLHVALSQ
jgi:peroxiredoxin